MEIHWDPLRMLVGFEGFSLSLGIFVDFRILLRIG